MPTLYINSCNKSYTTPLKGDEDQTLGHMLWGDPVTVLGPEEQGWTPVRTGRNRFPERRAWVRTDCLTNEHLLELYIIDVGQGDGVLMRTPDDKWHVVDAGVPNREQMTKKGAANFIWWKFNKDLGRPSIDLESVMITHPDRDHYGGLLDLLGGRLFDGREFPVSVRQFWHPGMGRFAVGEKLGQTQAGTAVGMPFPVHGITPDGNFIVELLDGKEDFATPPTDV